MVKRNPLTSFVRLAGILVAGVLLGYLLLLIAYALPVDRMEANVLLSASTFDGTAESVEARNQHVVKTYDSTWLDNSADSLILLMAIYRSDYPVWQQALRNEFYGNMEDNPYNLLRTYAAGGSAGMGSTAYFRYWHGHQAFLKPLLMVFTYMDLRILNMLAQGALLLWLILLMDRRGLRRYIPAFALSLVALTPWVLPLSLQYTPCYLLMLLGSIAVLQWPLAIRERLGGAAFFLLLGMATSYTDILTYPLVTFGIPFLFWLLPSDRLNARFDRPTLPLLARFGGAWLAGYAGMWAGKLALAWLLTGLPVWQVALTQVSLRTVGENLSPLDALWRNVRVFRRRPYMLLAACTGAWVAIQTVRTRGRRKPMRTTTALLYLATALLPLFWYVTIVNHSHIHYFFTHRSLAVTVFGLMCFVTRYLTPADRKAQQTPNTAGGAAALPLPPSEPSAGIRATTQSGSAMTPRTSLIKAEKPTKTK